VPPVSLPADGEPWDLLYFSDSTGWGVPERYAALASEALGVEVRVHDATGGGLAAATVLARIRGETFPDLSGDVRDAEIIVVFGNPENSGVNLDIGICVSTSSQTREPPHAYTPDEWRPYQDVVASIFEEIRALREGTPTVLRAVDAYNPVISPWRDAGIEPECTAAWESWSDAIRETAEANGATMVSMYDLFNGPDHQEDPREKGFIGSDGSHTTPEGAAAMAEALDAVGYEFSPAP
jgi:lysophospholipase L1-like esterase